VKETHVTNRDLSFNSIPISAVGPKLRFESLIGFFKSHSDLLKERDLYFNVLVKMPVRSCVSPEKKTSI
jgi:hypothetical protein